MTEKKELPEKNEMTRRSFIEKAAVSSAAFTILPRHVLGRGFTPPSDLLNIAWGTGESETWRFICCRKSTGKTRLTLRCIMTPSS